MKTIKVKFWCNSGNTEEVVDVDIYHEENEEELIQLAFHKWLEANEDCGWEKVYPQGVGSVLEDGVNE